MEKYTLEHLTKQGIHEKTPNGGIITKDGHLHIKDKQSELYVKMGAIAMDVAAMYAKQPEE